MFVVFKVTQYRKNMKITKIILVLACLGLIAWTVWDFFKSIPPSVPTEAPPETVEATNKVQQPTQVVMNPTEIALNQKGFSLSNSVKFSVKSGK